MSEWDNPLRMWLAEMSMEIMNVRDDSVDLGICTHVIRIGVDYLFSLFDTADVLVNARECDFSLNYHNRQYVRRALIDNIKTDVCTHFSVL